jgi:hypothetical protein
MAAPLLVVRGDYTVAGHDRKAEPARSGQNRMALLAWPELGIQVVGATEPDCLLQEADVAGEEN